MLVSRSTLKKTVTAYPGIVGLTQFLSKSNELKHMMYKSKYVHNLEEGDGWSSRKRMEKYMTASVVDVVVQKKKRGCRI